MNTSSSDSAFEAVLSTNLTRLHESYKMMLAKSAIEETVEFERQQLKTAIESVNSACQCILDQIHELRIHAVLGSDDTSGV